jgi:hypothetical protein
MPPSRIARCRRFALIADVISVMTTVQIPVESLIGLHFLMQSPDGQFARPAEANAAWLRMAKPTGPHISPIS